MKSQGFTLLEILVAVAIFALLGVAALSTLTTVQKADQSSMRHSEKLELLQRAYWTMERDFLQVAVRQNRLDGNEPSTYIFRAEENLMESEGQGVAFTRHGWTNPFHLLPRGNVQGVVYRLREGNLERLHTLYPDVAGGTEPKIRVLLENIESVKYKFYRGTTWQNNWTVEREVPKAIEVTLESDAFGEIRWVFLMTGAKLEATQPATT
ncbi:type II secretion system minor pseudopilin GspJ [Echinimonas agarilytica]|uniref:Type II secretion system protein J n=1 Tax=Echinimonas agarilytica TaxID=1215918 RepID=A0AA42B8V0_9GAMM|nr:type II secretion system minor pseudopilin GspJ [Echinimonas agarilytica]MCM2680888.1 type II secretion system minor pseudopilin GspJ [Echinimonas agarilytica]